MKFYYDGQLIRTSKNHHYTHACVIKAKDGKWKTLGCSSTREGAEKVKNQRIISYLNGIESYEKQIKALDEGKSGYYSKGYGFIKFSESYYKTDKESRLKEIEHLKAEIEKVKETWLIVEVAEA